jgi:predicted phage tail component-like protein
VIKLDDIYTFEDFGFKALIEHDHPLMADIENKQLKIPGKDGIYDFGTEIGVKSFLIKLDVIESDPVELQYKLNKFMAFLFDTYGKPRPIKAVFDYDPDKYYILRVNKSITPNRMIGVGQIELPFTAYDPYAYSRVYADEITWGCNVITFMSSYPLGHTGSDGLKTITALTTLNILVDGLVIKPVIEITGSATSLALSVNGYNITLPIFTASTWLIDCDKYTVLKNGANAFGLVSLREFILLHGSNQVQVSGTGINVTMRIKVRDKYM